MPELNLPDGSHEQQTPEQHYAAMLAPYIQKFVREHVFSFMDYLEDGFEFTSPAGNRVVVKITVKDKT